MAETRLSVDDLVAPLFVREGIDEPQPVASLPGVFQHTRTSLRAEVSALHDLGVPGVILFGIPERKDAVGSEAWNPDGIVQVALRDLRDDLGDDMVLLADLCVDEYTDHGHCGVLDGHGSVDNDATLELYARAAVAQADAGVAVPAYAAKYASALYGPFRDAVNVEIVGGEDRRGYQQDPPNAREATVEVGADLEEGADMVMVKPALAYLDVITDIRASVDVPLAAYHVSGEYAMVAAAAANGGLDGDAVGMEHLLAIRRAGADFILTYLAGRAAEILQG